MKRFTINCLVISFVLITFSSNLLFSQVANPTQWKYSVQKDKGNKVNLVFELAVKEGWHVYSQYFEDGGPNKMVINFTKSDDYKLIGKPKEVTTPHKEQDQLFKIEVQYFTGNAKIVQAIEVTSSKPFKVKGTIDYQVCQEERCAMFSPDFEFAVDGASAANDQPKIDSDKKKDDEISKTSDAIKETATTVVAQKKDSLSKSAVTTAITTKTSKASNDKLTGWPLFLAAFLGGLLALLTPCVFPMIPMTVSFFMKDKSKKGRARFEASIFGLSIVLIYTLIGTLASVIFGPTIGTDISSNWVLNLIFFAVFIIFAISFFGLFEITLPSWMVNKIDQQADKGGVSGAFFMALTLVVVSFSCTGPIVGTILVKSAEGEVISPIISMLGFSLAFAFPFTLFAFSPSLLKKLPKSGGWLNSVKVVFGFIELAFSLKFLSIADQDYHWNILSREMNIVIWIVLAILTGMYLLGKIKFAHDSDLKYVSVTRLFLAIAAFSFAVYLAPGLVGAPLKPLAGFLPPMTPESFSIANNSHQETADTSLCEKPKYADFLHFPHGLRGYFDYEQALKCAKQQHKPLFIDFTGNGCSNCRQMEANVWVDPRVLKRLKENFVIASLYVDDHTQLSEKEWITSKNDGKIKKELGKKNLDFEIQFGAIVQPYYVLLDNDGKTLVPPMGYNRNVEEYINFLDNAVAEFNKRSTQK